MNRELGLNLLSKIMTWEDEEARLEFQWLSFVAAYKYDGYQDYQAGARFIESLASWLQQFEENDRETAYNFVKENLIYFSPSEIQRLVEKLFAEHVQPDLTRRVSSTLEIPEHRVWATEESLAEYKWERRKTLFMGLSDGARIDTLRRMNVGVISNEQIVIATQISHSKWRSLLSDLNEDLQKIRKTGTKDEKFSRVYLLDDFTASGTSLLRISKGVPTGKLVRFTESVQGAIEELGENPFIEDFEVIVHHYIGTENAKSRIEDTYQDLTSIFSKFGVGNVKYSYGMLLPSSITIDKSSSHPFAKLCRKYYNNVIEGDGKHGGQSGTKEKMFGYANCGQPVVIEHNTPNNSLPLIWAETPEQNGNHRMRPLFRRRERHSDMNQSFDSTSGFNSD